MTTPATNTDPRQGSTEADSGTDAAAATGTIQQLRELGEQAVGEMKVGVMKQWLRQLGRPDDGTKADLADRLIGLIRGSDSGHVHGRTECRKCRKPARVVRVRNGYREMRCTVGSCGYSFRLPVVGGK